MSRKAAALRKSDEPASRSSRPRLHLVPRPAPGVSRQPKAPPPAPPARKQAPSEDPLEQPIPSHCGLCGNKIEDRSVTEKRTSGRNMKAQVWHYHEVCWKQLERMRRSSHADRQSHKAVNPDLRYGTSSCSLDIWSSVSDGLSFFAS